MHLLDIFCRPARVLPRILFRVHSLAHPRREICVEKFPAIVGRSEQSDIQLLDRLVSRTHCAIAARADAFVIRDLESHHGTWVNGRRISEETLAVGDEVWVGTTQLRVTSIVRKCNTL